MEKGENGKGDITLFKKRVMSPLFFLPNGDPNLQGTDLLGRNLSGGVNAVWDMSRRVAVRLVTTPPDITANPLDQNTNFPADMIVGNDDADADGEENDPYVAGQFHGTLFETDTVQRQGAGKGQTYDGFSDRGDSYVSKVYFQDFARLRLSSKWFVISDPNLWRVEYHMKKVSQTENNWQTDTNGQNGTENRTILETDTVFHNLGNPPDQNGFDWNGDGIVGANSVGIWLDDAGGVSFAHNDNAGYTP